MARNRFKLLLCLLRFDDKTTREERRQVHKLAPIAEIWDTFAGNCVDSYNPGECCTVDEHMLSFQGRCSFKMYLPSKPDKYGIKIFALTCSHCYFLWNASIYKGRQRTGIEHNLAANVVKKLVEPWSKSGSNITMDN